MPLFNPMPGRLNSLFTSMGQRQVGPSSAARGSILPPTGTGSLTLPSSANRAGTIIRIHGEGRYTTALVPGVLTFWITVNGADVGIDTIANLVGGISGACTFDAYVLIGAGGALTVNGMLSYETSAHLRQFSTIATTGTPSVTLDTALTIGVDAQWSISSPSNMLMGNIVFMSYLRAEQ